MTDRETQRGSADPFTSEREVYGRSCVWALTASESAALDERSRDAQGVPEPVLMESAGRAAAAVLQARHPEGRVLALVGPGNNGGDALVLVRTLRSWGRDAVWAAHGSRRPDGALAHGWDLPEVEATDAELLGAAVLVDGLLGTGATGAPREDMAALIRRMNASGRPVVALDLPTGADPTTGKVPGEAVDADTTVCFGFPKRGLLLQPARSRCGRLMAVEIGFPPLDSAGARVITPAWVAETLPVRAPDAHKSTAGSLLLIAGSAGIGGAAVLSGRGALRGGAGYLRLASAPENRGIVQGAIPDAVFVDRSDAGALRAAAKASTAVAAGPGMGTDGAAREDLETALEASGSVPVLLDADAVTLFGGRTALLRELAGKRPVVITPHPGEMARLVEEGAGEVAERRIDVARDFADAAGCVVLLKGQPSVVAAPGAAVWINSAGSSDVATAGMGDQLTGAVAALLAAGVEAADAAACGLFLCSRAADLVRRGPSLIPCDVADAYSDAWRRPGAASAPAGLPFVLFDQPARW